MHVPIQNAKNALIPAGKRELSPPAPSAKRWSDGTEPWAAWNPDPTRPVLTLAAGTLLLRLHAGLAPNGEYLPMDQRPTIFKPENGRKRTAKAAKAAKTNTAAKEGQENGCENDRTSANSVESQLLLFAVTGGGQ